MSKMTSLRTRAKNSPRRRHIACAQLHPPTQTTEEDMVTIILDDGTAQTISGKNLAVDMEYNDGIPYLVVRRNKDVIPD